MLFEGGCREYVLMNNVDRINRGHAMDIMCLTRGNVDDIITQLFLLHYRIAE